MADDLDEPEDADREAILRRRNKFLAVALASVAGSAACGDSTPTPCLSPMVCLEAPPIEVEPDPNQEGLDLPDPNGPVDPGTEPTMVEPQACLEYVPPDDDEPPTMG
ncbi:MAG: hypothetical protein AAGF12_00980 [Myxococcota bacterium]